MSLAFQHGLIYLIVVALTIAALVQFLPRTHRAGAAEETPAARPLGSAR